MRVVLVRLFVMLTGMLSCVLLAGMLPCVMLTGMLLQLSLTAGGAWLRAPSHP
jgi:hypothetical protein